MDWRPWGKEALALARAEGKPIFLSIGYSSCHWCHVMEEEVFAHDAVAELLNRHFVSIKVDREERPDLDAAYMEAVQTITGSGGWPLSVFLTREAKPFFGGTYFPRPQFMALLERVRDLYQERRDDLDAEAAALAARVTALPRLLEQPAAPVDADLLIRAAASAAGTFDARWGGVSAQHKFPTPARWHFLLRHHRRTGDPRSVRLVELTLVAMASGGIYDHVGGGFHRYTVEPTWVVPHFEKMLYDNAQLASLYLEAGASLGRPEHVAVGRDVLDFLAREMRGEEGGFYASFDADSGGEEGGYYLWDPDELSLAVGPQDGEALARLLGVTEAGNFEGGRTVLTRRADLAAVAREIERNPAELGRLFNRCRPALRAFRDRRARPALDTKIVTAWNGLAISAFAQGYAATGEEAYLAAAVRAADWLERAHRRPDGGLLRATSGGRAAGAAILDDYALLACGLLDLSQVTGDPVRLRRAFELVDLARARFSDGRGGYYLTASGAEAPLGRRIELLDGATPSGCAALLQALLRIATLTGREEPRAEAGQSLARHAELLKRAGLEMAWWLDAAARLIGPMYEVVVAGDAADRAAAALCAAALKKLPPHVALARVPAAGAGEELAALLPPAAGKAAPGGRPTAWVCERGTCLEPTTEPEALTRQILRGWAK